VYRDYGPKGVKFYFIYKTLAHPELSGGYVQPYTLDERLAHARQADKQLGATIPWLVDAMDNRLKRALGDRHNSEFVIDPEGKVVRKRAWSFPGELREDLEALVGKVDRVTREDEVKLKVTPPLKAPAARGVVPRITRPRMQAVVTEPQIDPKKPPFYAKLRAEAEADLLSTGAGKLYLGFHLDPFHHAHWNNLTEPLRYKFDLPAGAKFAKATGEAAAVKAASDTDPREFLLDVENWPKDQPLRLTVTYSACVGDKACHTVSQSYVLRRKHDIDGGGARGDGAGFWNGPQFAKQMLTYDRDGDGKLTKDEVKGLIRPYFDELDRNRDGFLDAEEIKIVATWLNEHHAPDPAAKAKR
jgi:hypothetical protein